jgi:hypothetical protein
MYDIGRCIEPAAVRVHVENDRGRFVALGCFHCAAQESEKRRRNFAVQRHDGYVAFANRFTRLSRCDCRQKTRQEHDP